MFEAYKNLINQRFSLVDRNKLFILNRWASFNKENSEGCCDFDRVFLACKNKDLLITLLYTKLKSKGIPKFLKAEKQDKDLLNYVKKFYGFSNKELSWQMKLINLEDKEFLNKMSVKFGWDKKTCKKYNVAWVTPKKEKMKKEEKKPVKGLFDF